MQNSLKLEHTVVMKSVNEKSSVTVTGNGTDSIILADM